MANPPTYATADEAAKAATSDSAILANAAVGVDPTYKPLPVSDAEAGALYSQYDTADDPQKKIIAGIMGQYYDQQDAAKAQATSDHIAKLYTDPNYFAANTNTDAVNEATKLSPDPGQSKQRIVNQAYFANQLGVDASTMDGSTYDAYRDGFAQKFLGKQTASDSEVFSGIAKQQQTALDTKKAFDEIPSDTITAAVNALSDGKFVPSAPQLLQAWKDKHPEIPPTTGDESAAMDGIHKYLGGLVPFVKQYGFNIQAAAKVLGTMGDDARTGDQNDVPGLAASLVNIPFNDREKILQVAAIYAKANAPKESDAVKVGSQLVGSFYAPAYGAVTGISDLEREREAQQAIDDHTAHSPADAAGLKTLQDQQTQISIEREIRDAANQQVNPVTPVFSGAAGYAEQTAYGAAGMALPVGTSLIPYVGPGLTFAAFSAQQYEATRSAYPDLPLDQARTMALLKGGAMAATNYLTAGAALGKLPMTANFFKALEDAPPSILNSIGKGVATGGEIGLQTGAFVATPTIVDGLAKTLGADVPQFDWNDQLNALKGAEYSGMISALPFFLIGAGAIGIHDVPAIAKTFSDAKALSSLLDVDPTIASKIVSERDPLKKQALYDQQFQNKTDEQKQIIVQRISANADAAQAANNSPARATMRAVKGVDEHGAPQDEWEVTSATGAPSFRTTDLNAALDAFHFERQHDPTPFTESEQPTGETPNEPAADPDMKAVGDMERFVAENPDQKTITVSTLHDDTSTPEDKAQYQSLIDHGIIELTDGETKDGQAIYKINKDKLADFSSSRGGATTGPVLGIKLYRGQEIGSKNKNEDGIHFTASEPYATQYAADYTNGSKGSGGDGEVVAKYVHANSVLDLRVSTPEELISEFQKHGFGPNDIVSSDGVTVSDIANDPASFEGGLFVGGNDYTNFMGNFVKQKVDAIVFKEHGAESPDETSVIALPGARISDSKENTPNLLERKEGVAGDSSGLGSTSAEADQPENNSTAAPKDQVQFVKAMADQAREEIKNFGPGASSVAEFDHNYAVVGLSHLLEGKADKASWMAAMREEYEGFDQEKLDEVWRNSQKMLRDFQGGEIGKDINPKTAINANTGVKKPIDKVSVNPVTAQKSSLRAAEKAGEAGFKRGVKETWAIAKVKMAALKTQLKDSVSKMTALNRYFAGMEKGAKQATATTKKQLAMADKWLAADVEKYRRMLVDYVTHALPPAERGRFIGAITKALERPALLDKERTQIVGKNSKLGKPGYEAVIGGQQKMINSVTAVTQAIDERAHEVYRKDLANEIRTTIARSIRSPSVDIRYKAAMERIISDINLKNPRESTLEELAKTAEYLQRMRADGKDVDMPASVLAKLEQLAQTPLDDLPTAVLEDIQRKLELAEKTGRMSFKNRAIRWADEKRERLGAMLSSPGKPLESHVILRAQPGEKLTLGDRLSNYINARLNNATALDLGTLPQDIIFDMLQGSRGTYQGALFTQVRTPIDASYNAAMRRYLNVRSGLRAIIKKHGLGQASSERIGLYAALQQDGGEGRALDSGVTKATIDKLKSSGLSAGEFEAYTHMREQLDATLPQVRGVMHDLYNVAVDAVKNYFPFMREWDTYKPDPESPIKDAVTGETISAEELSTFSQMAGNFYAQGTSKLPMGMTLDRKEGASGPIRFDSFGTFERHMVNASRLIEMQREMKMVGEMVRDDSFASKYGDLGQKLVNDWLTTVANDGGGASVTRWRMMDKIVQGTSRSMVFFNPISNIKHASAIPMGMVNAGGAAHWWRGISAAHTPEGEAFMSNFPEVTERNSGELTIEDFQKLVDSFSDSKGAALMRGVDKYGFMVGKFIDHENSTAVFIGRYLKNLEDKGLKPDLSGPIDQEAAYNAITFMRRTVSSTHAKDLPAVLTRGFGGSGKTNLSLAKAFFQFKQFVMERYSQVRYDLPAAVAQKDFGKAIGMVSAISAAVLYETNISPAVHKAAALAYSQATGQPQQEDKRDKEVFTPAEIAKRAAWDVVGLPPYSSPVIAGIQSGMAGGWMGAKTGIPVLDALAAPFFDIGKIAAAKGAKNKTKAGIQAASDVATAAGLPGAGEVSKIARGVIGK